MHRAALIQLYGGKYIVYIDLYFCVLQMMMMFTWQGTWTRITWIKKKKSPQVIQHLHSTTCRHTQKIVSPKHNKLPERVFGYLDYLIHKRPNSTAIANEAQVMYVFNKTAAFVDSKSDTELEGLVKTVRTEARTAQVTAKKQSQETMRYWGKKKQEEKSKAMLKDCGCAVVICL